MTKKQLQKQIEEKGEAIQGLNRELDYVKGLLGYKGTYNGFIFNTNGLSDKEIQNLRQGRPMMNVYERMIALEKHLNLEWKVTESQREEGYVVKESQTFGVAGQLGGAAGSTVQAVGNSIAKNITQAKPLKVKKK